MNVTAVSMDNPVQDIRASVRQYILDNFLMGNEEAYADDASFMDAQLLDSTGFLELVQFLEETYGIRVEDMEMMPDNLDSLVAVEQFVLRKRAA